MLLTSQLQVLTEALVIGKKAGLDQSQMVEVFGTTSSASPAVKSRGQVMVSQSQVLLLRPDITDIRECQVL